MVSPLWYVALCLHYEMILGDGLWIEQIIVWLISNLLQSNHFLWQRAPFSEVLLQMAEVLQLYLLHVFNDDIFTTLEVVYLLCYFII